MYSCIFSPAEFLLSCSLPVRFSSNLQFSVQGKGKNNKSKLMRYPLYLLTSLFFSSCVTAGFERRKQGVKLNVKNENCPPGEKKGRRKSEGWVSNSLGTCDVCNFQTWQLHWGTERKGTDWETVSQTDLWGKYVSILPRLCCYTCTAQHRRRMAATGGRRILTCFSALLSLPSLQGEYWHTPSFLQAQNPVSSLSFSRCIHKSLC